MYQDEALVETFVAVALQAMRSTYRDKLGAVLDVLPAPAYVTDPFGAVTHFNEACIKFAGRLPVVGEDRWCVTWRLLTAAGEALPHDQCPMAEAIRQKKSMRGAVAIALRPDGSRATFKPFPTPLLDDEGNLVGAINIFLDLSLETKLRELKHRAQNCRRLALNAPDAASAATFDALAEECEASARTLENPN